MNDKDRRENPSFFEDNGPRGNLLADLAAYCRYVAAAVSWEETERKIVDSAWSALHCDFAAYLTLSKRDVSISSYASRGCLRLDKDTFPLAALLQLLRDEFNDEPMTRPARRLFGACHMSEIFTFRERDFFQEGGVSTLPSSDGDLLYILLIGFRDPRLQSAYAIPFIDTLLSVADISRRKLSSDKRFRAEHERVVRAKQEWQCSVDALNELVCLVDASGRVVRANKTLEQLGLGQVTTVRGRYIWELLRLLDDSPTEQDDLLDELCQQQPDDWSQRWESAVARGYVEWVFCDHSNKNRYRVAVTIVNLRTSYDPNTNKHAVVVVQALPGSQLIEWSSYTSADPLTLDLEAKTQELLMANRQLEMLSDELINAQEDERTRVAVELHDGLGQELVMLKLQLDCLLEELPSSCVTSEPAQRIKEVRRNLRHAIEETRRIGMNLRPPMLDTLGIQPTLRWFFREFNKANPAMELSVEITVDEELLISSLETELFRITQEAMTNIAKHANASRVRYELKSVENWICLKIEDDGIGFRARETPITAAGIRNMSMRASRSGGQLCLQTAPGDGVRISVDWHL